MSTSQVLPSTDGAAVRGQPPLYYIVSFAISLAIHYFVFPLPLTLPAIGPVGGAYVRIALGALLLVLGAGLMIATIVQFKRTGNDPNPHSPTRSIITTGPYRITRNPIYLSTGLVQVALGVMLGSLWTVASGLLALILVHSLAVLPEEEYLEGKFGDEYLQYKASVRRWI